MRWGVHGGNQQVSVGFNQAAASIAAAGLHLDAQQVTDHLRDNTSGGRAKLKFLGTQLLLLFS